MTWPLPSPRNTCFTKLLPTSLIAVYVSCLGPLLPSLFILLSPRTQTSAPCSSLPIFTPWWVHPSTYLQLLIIYFEPKSPHWTLGLVIQLLSQHPHWDVWSLFQVYHFQNWAPYSPPQVCFFCSPPRLSSCNSILPGQTLWSHHQWCFFFFWSLHPICC